MHRRTEAKPDTIKTIVIVADPGRIRDSLEALLQTMPQVEVVSQMADDSTMHEFITKCRPDLVLLVTPLSHERTAETLAYLRNDPGTPCLVLADTVRHLEQAKAAGADEALLAGISTSKLFESVGILLSPET